MSTRREERRKKVLKHDPGAPTLFVQIFPAAPSGANKRIPWEDRAALVVEEILQAPGGRQLVKLVADGHITITEYDSVSMRSRLIAGAARAALGGK